MQRLAPNGREIPLRNDQMRHLATFWLFLWSKCRRSHRKMRVNLRSRTLPQSPVSQSDEASQMASRTEHAALGRRELLVA